LTVYQFLCGQVCVASYSLLNNNPTLHGLYIYWILKLLLIKYKENIMNYSTSSYTQLNSLGSSRYLVYTQVFMSVFSKRTMHNIKNENLVTLAFTTTRGAFIGERLWIWLSSPSSINLVFSNVIQDMWCIQADA
jgi:hypothetical protein